MPSPMPPLPPVMMATLPPRSNGLAVIAVCTPKGRSAFGLPDEDQPKRRQRRAIAGPLDLIDHEARLRPFDCTGALADPEQAYGKREQPDNEKRGAHMFPPGPSSSAVAPVMRLTARK